MSESITEYRIIVHYEDGSSEILADHFISFNNAITVFKEEIENHKATAYKLEIEKVEWI